MNRILDSLDKKIKSAKGGIERKKELENAVILLERKKEPIENKVGCLLHNLKTQENNSLKLKRKTSHKIDRQLDIRLKEATAKTASAKEEYESVNKELERIKQEINLYKKELNSLSNIQDIFKQLCNDKINFLISNPSLAPETFLEKVDKNKKLKAIEENLQYTLTQGRQLSVMLKYLDKSFDKAINCAILQRDIYGRKMPFLSEDTVKSAILDSKSIIYNIVIKAELLNTALKAFDSFIKLGQFYFDDKSLIEFLEFYHTWKTKKEGKCIILKAKTELDIIINNISNLLSEVTKDTRKYKSQIQDTLLQSIN